MTFVKTQWSHPRAPSVHSQLAARNVLRRGLAVFNKFLKESLVDLQRGQRRERSNLQLISGKLLLSFYTWEYSWSGRTDLFFITPESRNNNYCSSSRCTNSDIAEVAMEHPRHGDSSSKRESRYLMVLPVLFYEFLALALIRGLLPTLMLDFWGKWTYTVIGVIDTGKG